MYRLSIVAYTLVTILALSISLPAQTLKLSLDDALKRSIESSKLLKASRAKMNIAEAKVSEVSTALLPSLKLQGSYTRLSDVVPISFGSGVYRAALPTGDTISVSSASPSIPVVLNNWQFNLNATQVLFAGGKLSASVDASNLNASAASLDLRNDELDNAFNTTLAFWSLFKAQELRRSFDESIKQISARVKDAENLFKAGMITNNDVLRLQVQQANIKVQSLDVEQQIRTAMVGLCNRIGVALGTNLELSTALNENQESLITSDAIVSSAQKDRPDVRANEFRLSAANESVTIANSGWYPTIAANASYLYANPNQRIFPQKEQFDGTWAVGVSLQWDLWSWMAPRYQAQQAEAQVKQLRESIDAQKDGIAVEIAQNMNALAPARERISVASTAVSQAQENYTVMTNRYKAGTATATELLEAESLLLQSKINKTSAQVDLEISLARLNRSLGK